MFYASYPLSIAVYFWIDLTFRLFLKCENIFKEMALSLYVWKKNMYSLKFHIDQTHTLFAVSFFIWFSHTSPFPVQLYKPHIKQEVWNCKIAATTRPSILAGPYQPHFLKSKMIFLFYSLPNIMNNQVTNAKS